MFGAVFSSLVMAPLPVRRVLWERGVTRWLSKGVVQSLQGVVCFGPA